MGSKVVSDLASRPFDIRRRIEIELVAAAIDVKRRKTIALKLAIKE